MIISQPRLKKENGIIRYCVTIEDKYKSRDLWYSVDECHRTLLTEKLDAFLIGLIIPAMFSGEDIYIKGKVSRKLLHNAHGPLQEMLKVIIPSLQSIKIEAQEVVTSCNTKDSGVATGFSAGIDSFSVLADYYYSNNDFNNLTHLLFNNVGSHGKGGDELFNNRFNKLKKITNIIGLPLIKVNSNLDSFYNETLYFKQTHTLRNASVALLLQNGISSFMYASAYHFKDCTINKSNDTSKSDPISLPLMSTNDMDLISVGNEYTRADKTKMVSQISDSYEFLDVCISHRDRKFINCGKCSKCLRTLVTLEIYGALIKYSKVFDINAYRKKRTIYLMLLLGKRDPMSLEILELAKTNNFSFPVISLSGYYLGISHLLAFIKQLRTNSKNRKRSRRSNT